MTNGKRMGGRRGRGRKIRRLRSGGGHGSGIVRRVRLRLPLISALCLLTPTLAAQPVGWRPVADGAPVAWTPPRAVPPDSAEAAAALALGHLPGEGFLLARIDSAAVAGGAPTLYATRGPRPVVADVRLTGVRALDAEAFLATAETRPGRPYRPEALA